MSRSPTAKIIDGPRRALRSKSIPDKRPRAVRLNNRLRRTVEAALGGLDVAVVRSRQANPGGPAIGFQDA